MAQAIPHHEAPTEANLPASTIDDPAPLRRRRQKLEVDAQHHEDPENPNQRLWSINRHVRQLENLAPRILLIIGILLLTPLILDFYFSSTTTSQIKDTCSCPTLDASVAPTTNPIPAVQPPKITMSSAEQT
jgi:hypothetical protein